MWPLSLCCEVLPLTWCLFACLFAGPASSCVMDQETHLGNVSSNVKGLILIWFNSAVIEVVWAPHGFQL